MRFRAPAIAVISVLAALPAWAAFFTPCCYSGLAPVPVSNTGLGTNLNYPSYFSTTQPFLDYLKTGTEWSGSLTSGTPCSGGARCSENPDLPFTLDSNGFPTTFTGTGAAAGHTFSEIDTAVLESSSEQSGWYELIFTQTGSGQQINLTRDASAICTSSPCFVNVIATTSGIGIQITNVSASGYVNKAHLIYCNGGGGVTCGNGADTQLTACIAEGEAGGDCFQPSFLTALAPFKTYRFMDWYQTKANFETNTRPIPTQVFWSDTAGGQIPVGVPYEVLAALCNKQNANGWFNVPPLAGDTLVTSLANVIATNLNNKAYVEYGNELWQGGGGFASGIWTSMTSSGLALFTTCVDNGFQCGFMWAIYEQVHVGLLWKAAYGSSAATKLIPVLGGQGGQDTGGGCARNAYIMTTVPNGSNSCQASQGGPSTWDGTATLSAATVVKTNSGAFATATYWGYATPDSWSGMADPLTILFSEINSGGNIPLSSQCTTTGNSVTQVCAGLTASPINGTMVDFTVGVGLTNGTSATIGPSGSPSPLLYNDGSCTGNAVPAGYLSAGIVYIASYTTAAAGCGSITNNGYRVFVGPGIGNGAYTTGMVAQAAANYVLDAAEVANPIYGNGIALDAYEAGTQMQSNSGCNGTSGCPDTALNTQYSNAMQDSRMGTVTTSYYAGLCSAGVTFANQFLDIWPNGLSGFYWGLLRSQYTLTDPKYVAAEAVLCP